MEVKTTHLRIAGLVLLIAVIGVLSIYLDPSEVTDPERLQERARASLPSAAALFFLGGLAVKLLFVPASPLTVVAGMVFGPWIGASLSLATLLASSVLSFGLARWLGREWARSQVEDGDRRRLRTLERIASRHGVLAVTIVRLVPILPLAASNVLLGLTSVSWRDFLAGSLLGFLPGTILLAQVGSEVLDPGGARFWVFTSLFALLVIAGVTAAEVLRRREMA
jgi:uncharacterized membrane protein YdjX (TVP38/TMEM64 family)